jgi:hypothetical protein
MNAIILHFTHDDAANIPTKWLEDPFTLLDLKFFFTLNGTSPVTASSLTSPSYSA